jgi:hypothetical protein
LQRLAFEEKATNARRACGVVGLMCGFRPNIGCMSTTHFGFEKVDESEKARRVRGVFDSVARATTS